MEEQYYSRCCECEHCYHCHGRETAEKIKKGETDSMYLRTDSCADYYPEVSW